MGRHQIPNQLHQSPGSPPFLHPCFFKLGTQYLRTQVARNLFQGTCCIRTSFGTIRIAHNVHEHPPEHVLRHHVDSAWTLYVSMTSKPNRLPPFIEIEVQTHHSSLFPLSLPTARDSPHDTQNRFPNFVIYRTQLRSLLASLTHLRILAVAMNNHEHHIFVISCVLVLLTDNFVAF